MFVSILGIQWHHFYVSRQFRDLRDSTVASVVSLTYHDRCRLHMMSIYQTSVLDDYLSYVNR